MNKLKSFPHVFYFTLDCRTKRHNYMENQFKFYGIDFTKISMPFGFPEYLNKNILNVHSKLASKRCLAYNYFLIETMRTWYFKTSDEYFVIMEDDYDLSFIKYWHFDWDYLISRLPYDWDCIQLGHECSSIVKFYLHPIESNYSLGPALIKREYVEKFLDLFYVGGKYKFTGTIANSIYINRESKIGEVGDSRFFIDIAGSADYFLCQSGNTYTIPLIPCNPFLKGVSHLDQWYPIESFICCYEAYKEWWNNDKNNFTLDEFFTFGKSNDNLMERDISRWDYKYFHEKAMLNRLNYA